MAEAIDGYGFLAVFLSARTARQVAPDDEARYEREVHHSGDQLEAILLVLLLLWLGTFIGHGTWAAWTWPDLGVALALVLVVRPSVAMASLIGIDCGWRDRLRIAVFGVRGMGSIFYVAYAQTHATFADIDVVWRVTALVILISIVLHGFGARIAMPEDTDEAGPS